MDATMKLKRKWGLMIVLILGTVLCLSCSSDKDATTKLMPVSSICGSEINPDELTINGNKEMDRQDIYVRFEKEGNDSSVLKLTLSNVFPAEKPNFEMDVKVQPKEFSILFSGSVTQKVGKSTVVAEVSGEIGKIWSVDRTLRMNLNYKIENSPLLETPQHTFSFDDPKLFSIFSLHAKDETFEYNNQSHSTVEVITDGITIMRNLMGKTFDKVQLQFKDDGVLLVNVLWKGHTEYEKWMETRYWLTDKPNTIYWDISYNQSLDFSQKFINKPQMEIAIFYDGASRRWLKTVYQTTETDNHPENNTLNIMFPEITWAFLSQWCDNKGLVEATDEEKEALKAFRKIVGRLLPKDTGDFEGIMINSGK